jgi:hypothetical protein
LLKLVEYKCRESVSILKVLLELALKGKLRGLVICYRTDDGTERTIYTGAYKAHPGRAAEASLRMSLRLMQANGDMD